jgi:hypothetical protein
VLGRSGETRDKGSESVAPDRRLVAVMDKAAELNGCQSFASGVEVAGGSLNGAPAEEPSLRQALDPRVQAGHRGGGWLRLAGELRWRNWLPDGKRAALSAGEAVVHIQRSSLWLAVTTEVAALQRDCFDAKPILQDPTSEALEMT